MAEIPVRLNIGCGRRILDGWVNIDKAARGRKPDIDADVMAIPLPDNHADEAMAIHLIEHFYAWEAPDVLKEWMRVLKPGGRLVLECPDLNKAIRFMVSGVDKASLTMWPLYGDPSHKDPLMCHKWGYTPETLSELMEEAGFIDVREEPAQFHAKEIRDMRIVGVKPC